MHAAAPAPAHRARPRRAVYAWQAAVERAGTAAEIAAATQSSPAQFAPALA